MCMDQLTDRLPGIINIHDDICVYSKTQEQHDKHLLQLMKTAAKQGLVFNSNKCYISQPQITFYSTIFSAQGIKTRSYENTHITGPSHSTNTETTAINPRISQLPSTLPARYSQ